MESFQKEILSKYSRDRLNRLRDEKNDVINYYHSISGESTAINALIRDIKAMCNGRFFSIEDLYNDNNEEYEPVIDGLKYFIGLICFKHRAESSHCRRFVCAMFSHASNGDDYTAHSMYTILLSATSGIANQIIAPSTLGAKGGRPQNRHKLEALSLAKDKWQALPAAGLGAVITSVKHQLEKKYKDAPSISALKAWLKDANFRPNESRRK